MVIGRIIVIILLGLVQLVLIQNATANHTVAPKGNTVTPYHYDSSETQLIKIKSNHDSDCSYDERWFCFNSTTKTHQCAIHGHHSHITCSDSGPLLQFGFCATYSEATGLVTVNKCPYLQVKGHNMASTGYHIRLPKRVTDLNDSLCGPMNRKGIVCSECIDGFGTHVLTVLMPGIGYPF